MIPPAIPPTAPEDIPVEAVSEVGVAVAEAELVAAVLLEMELLVDV